MIINGKHYFTTSQFIKESLDNGEDYEYIVIGLNDIGIERQQALFMIDYYEKGDEKK